MQAINKLNYPFFYLLICCEIIVFCCSMNSSVKLSRIDLVLLDFHLFTFFIWFSVQFLIKDIPMRVHCQANDYGLTLLNCFKFILSFTVNMKLFLELVRNYNNKKTNITFTPFSQKLSMVRYFTFCANVGHDNIYNT